MPRQLPVTITRYVLRHAELVERLCEARIDMEAEMARIDVVIADQHHLVRAGFSLILQSLDGVNVAETDSVAGAVDLVAKHRPKLVLVSVGLGESGDFELIRRIRQLGDPQPCILVMVGSRDGDVAELVTRSGADGTVAKYATPEEIVASIRGAVAA